MMKDLVLQELEEKDCDSYRDHSENQMNSIENLLII